MVGRADRTWRRGNRAFGASVLLGVRRRRAGLTGSRSLQPDEIADGPEIAGEAVTGSEEVPLAGPSPEVADRFAPADRTALAVYGAEPGRCWPGRSGRQQRLDAPAGAPTVCPVPVLAVSPAAVGSVSPAPAATVTWSEVAPVWHPAGVMAHRPARWRPLLPGAASSASVEVQWTAGAGSAPGRSESETPERYEGPGAAALARR